GDASVLALSGNGRERSLGGRPVRSNMPSIAGEEACLVLRPEKLRVMSDQDDDSWNRFRGTVSDVVYQGDSILLSVALDSGENVFLRQSTDQQSLAALPGQGQAIEVGLH